MINSFCEFSAAIQLAATFNLGCIALSGQRSFAHSLSNYFFRVEDNLNAQFQDIKQRISADKQSLSNMPTKTILGNDYGKEAELLNSEFESLTKMLDKKAGEVSKTISDEYTPKFLDSLCIILGMYSIYELVLSVFIKITPDAFILRFYALNTLNILLFIWCIIGEVINYRAVFCKKSHTNFFTKIIGKNSVMTSFLLLVISILFPYINSFLKPQIECSPFLSAFHFYVGLLLPFSGFIFYWAFIQILSRKAKTFILKNINPIKESFNKLHEKREKIDIILNEFSVDKIQLSRTKQTKENESSPTVPTSTAQ